MSALWDAQTDPAAWGTGAAGVSAAIVLRSTHAASVEPPPYARRYTRARRTPRLRARTRRADLPPLRHTEPAEEP
jgi:hypothetical protein